MVQEEEKRGEEEEEKYEKKERDNTKSTYYNASHTMRTHTACNRTRMLAIAH